jgi:hypothetical protein
MGNATLHTPLNAPLFMVQLMPAGELVMVPPPRDAGDGVTLSVAGIDAAENPTPTVVVLPGTTVALQVVPLHAPLNPVNAPFPVLTAFIATAIPAAKTDEQVPFVTPAEMVHEIPSGTLVTLPLPVPKPLIAIVPGACGMRNVASTIR